MIMKCPHLIIDINWFVCCFSFQEGEQYASKNGLLFMEASAKTGENVEEAFMTTSIQVLEHVRNGVFELGDDVSRC